jgi:hypothetical protein
MRDDTNAAGFSDDETRVLSLVLDEIIPPSPERGLPGAGEAGVVAYVERVLRTLPDLRSLVTQGLADLDALARSRHGRRFTALPRADRQVLLADQSFVFPLTLHTFVGYYQTARVAEALGLEPRPPHPKGYDMEPNDLTLLDSVRRRPKLFREC